MSVDPSVEHLYDEYLDAAMAGRAEPPDQFLHRAGVSSAALRAALEAVYGEYTRRGSAPTPAPGGEGPTPESQTSPGNPAEPPRPARHSDIMGDFRLLDRLGEGGMGVVFLAEQISLRRRVAVKLLRPEVAHSHAASTRFEREALAAAKLNHPHIVHVIAVGEHRGARYIAMEYIEGRGLDEVLKQAAESKEPVAVTRAVRWCAQIARALASAHQHGIVHRDVKPSNIRIAPDDRALLLDFGVARELGSGAATLTETFVGSPFYAAPEQVAAGGGELDGRTDVYSLGLVLYECLTGRTPFAGGTLEQVLHAILTLDPPPPRRSVKSIPRDVDTVVMKAIEKVPARRYAGAAEFADDLDAILDLRPISARPHGPVERLSRWARRRKPQAAAIGTAMLAVVLVGGLLGLQSFERQRQRAAQARALIAEANGLVAKFAASRESMRSAEGRFEGLAKNRVAGYLSPQEDAEVDAAESAVRRARREREAMFYRVLDIAAQAEREGAAATDAEDVRARAYLQRFLEAEVTDSIDRPMYRDLVAKHDPDGRLSQVLRGSTSISLICDVPSVRLDLFKRVYDSDAQENGERRLVSVPLRGQPPGVAVGSWGLRVVRGAGDLRPEDHIVQVCGQPVRGSVFLLRDAGTVPRGARLLTIDDSPVPDMYWARTLSKPPPAGVAPHRFTFTAGANQSVVTAADLESAGLLVGDARALAELGGVPAQVWTAGASREMSLPTGLVVRTTAAPLLVSEQSRLSPAEARDLSLEPGCYLFLATAPGMEPLRLSINAERGTSQKRRLVMRPDGSSPEGFVRVVGAAVIGPSPKYPGEDEHRDFWFMEREVTLREYYEFLNDPQTLREIDASQQRIRYPYNAEEAAGQRDAQGRFLLPEGWGWDWPALHISWNDAKAYAAWRTARARAHGLPWEFDLPTFEQWLEAAAGNTGSSYVFGDRFSPKWCSSCFARPKPWPEPVMSFPIDESALGAFDMAGSISEWTNSPWQPNMPHLRHAGGSWATGDPLLFNLYGGNGALPDRNAGFIGFRLVARAAEGSP